MKKIKPWSEIQFKLVPALSFGNWGVKLMSDQINGNILAFSERGVYLISGIGGSHGFDLNGIGRLKPYRGNAADLMAHWFDCVSEVEAMGRTFFLWKNDESEQLIINSSGHNMLLINKSGLHRFPGVPDEFGLPIDKWGNMLVLK